MLNSFRTKKSNVFVWILLGGLIIGLAGFGIGSGGSLIGSDIATVGERGISSQDYARAVDQDIRALSAQAGRSITIDQARQFGLDRSALSRLVNNTALDGEAAALGYSSGDEVVREQLSSIPNFQGSDGFDKEAYAYTLERMGVSASDFEEQLRLDSSRELLVTGIGIGTKMPETAANTILAYLGEKRGFSWIRLDAGNLPEAVAAPSETDLVSYHEENTDVYTIPETTEITYVAAIPAQVAESIDIPDTELRTAFDAIADTLGTPEQRFLDRIGFGNTEDAIAAKTRLDNAETDFDALGAERGLTTEDMDQGIVANGDLDSEANDLVFSHDGPGIVGPVETSLGPALFRINGVVAAKTVSFEEAREGLKAERALEQARLLIANDIRVIDDLIAGGATIEEIASETVMERGNISLNTLSTGDLANDPAFRDLVQNARENEVSDLAELADGGLVAVQIDAVVEPRVQSLDEVREQVETEFLAAATQTALTTFAEDLSERLTAGGLLADIATETGKQISETELLTRTDILPGTPPRLIADIFSLAQEGEIAVVEDEGTVILAHLTTIEPYDTSDETTSAIYDTLGEQLSQQAANDLVSLFTSAVRDAAGVSVNQALIDSTLSQFQ